MGVSYQEFWELTPSALLLISKAYDQHTQLQLDLLWLQGLYIQYAFASTQSNKVKYPTQPFHRKKEEFVNGHIAGDVAKDRLLRMTALINKKQKGGED